jgi:hypothetical protein
MHRGQWNTTIPLAPSWRSRSVAPRLKPARRLRSHLLLQPRQSGLHLSPNDENPQAAVPVSANAHQVTADWVVSVRVLNVRPLALGGVGPLVVVPVTDQTLTSTSTLVVYVYGAGFDVGLIPHFGLRLQCRGNLNKGSTSHRFSPRQTNSCTPRSRWQALYIRF